MNNHSLYMPIADPRVRMLRVRFSSNYERVHTHGKLYTYKCDMPYVTAGNVVIVEARDWYAVARVVDEVAVPIDDDETVFRWIVAVLNEDLVERRLEREAKLVKSINDHRIKRARDQLHWTLGLSSDEMTEALTSVGIYPNATTTMEDNDDER